MIRTLVFAALLLPGCSAVTPLFGPAKPVSAQEEACRSQANDAPAVKAIMNKFEGSEHYQREHLDDLNAAKQDATVACLQGRGVVQRGGVERQKPLQ